MEHSRQFQRKPRLSSQSPSLLIPTRAFAPVPEAENLHVPLATRSSWSFAQIAIHRPDERNEPEQTTQRAEEAAPAVQRTSLHPVDSALANRIAAKMARSSTAPMQLMKSEDIQIGKTYKYKDSADDTIKQGKLQGKGGGGRYTFDNGKARGAGNVLSEVVTSTAMDIEESSTTVLNTMEGENKKEEKEEESEEEMEETLTIREMFMSYLAKKNIKDQSTINLLVDLNEKQLKLARENRVTFQKYKQSWKEYTSCFDAAERLFILLGDPASLATNSWESKEALKDAIPKLTADIQKIGAAGSSCIYRIGVAREESQDHSFVIVIQNNRAELLQSFAGNMGEALGENLRKEGTHSIADLILLLNNLTNADDKIRASSQITMFEGRIDDKQDLRSNIFFMRIDRRGLYNQTDLQKNIQAKIDANIKVALSK